MAQTVDAETGEVLADAPLEFPDVRIHRRFISQRDGKDFVAYTGLVDALHQVSQGFFSIETRIEQLPGKENDLTAVVSARVSLFSPEDHEDVLRVATGIGDANPGNVGRMMAPHLIRMAETRAKARALRDLLSVAMVSVEELGEHAVPSREDGPSRGEPSDSIEVEGKRFTRDQVFGAYRRRLERALELDMAVPPEDATLSHSTPLPRLLRATTELKRRLDARAGQPAS